MTPLRWEWTAYGRTDRGLVRRTNQDTFLVDNRHRLWAVADGMGGHQGGEVASRLVVDTLADFAPTMREAALDPSTPEEEVAIFRLTTMVEQAHEILVAQAARDRSLEGMGTTLVLAHLLDVSAPRLIIVNIGDSRAYVVRNQTITQVTRDHTLIEEQIREGRLSPEEAVHHPDRHVLTRAMGLGPKAGHDLFFHDVIDGDLLLLCSDGLTKMLSDERMLETVLPHQHSAPHAVQALVDAALEQGGADNVTVVACPMTRQSDPANRH
jgi:PPM family protein phosphatase